MLLAVAVAISLAASPCKLVTAADASAALGGTVGKPKAQTLGLYQSCTYAHGTAIVTVQSRPLSKANFVTSAKANPKPVVAVSGLGGQAFFVASFTLLAWKKGMEVTFTVTGAGGSPLTVEKALARKALARI